jgi:hypothetical protein
MLSPLRIPGGLPTRHFWRSDRGLTALLVGISLLTFVFLPLETSGVISPAWMFLVDVWTAGILLAGASALGWRRLQRGILVAIVVALLLLLGPHLLARGFSVPWTEALRSGLAAVVFGVLTTLILAQVFREGPTTRDRIFGAVAVYLLIGLICAELFRLIQVLDPVALSGVHWRPGATNLSTYVYFSLTTLTTMGYGDILPVSLAARSLANCEALLGQLFPAILIARLVSMSITAPPAQRPPEGE